MIVFLVVLFNGSTSYFVRVNIFSICFYGYLLPSELSEHNEIFLARARKEALLRVVSWLGDLEVMRLARAPLTTEALGSNAVKAIQKAADVRNAKLSQIVTPSTHGREKEAEKCGQEKKNTEVVTGLSLSDVILEPTLLSLRELKRNFNHGS